MVQTAKLQVLRNGKRNMVAARHLRYTSTAHRNPGAAFLEIMPIACLDRFTVTGVRGPFVETRSLLRERDMGVGRIAPALSTKLPRLPESSKP